MATQIPCVSKTALVKATGSSRRIFLSLSLAREHPVWLHAVTANHPQGLGITRRGRQRELLQATQQNWAVLGVRWQQLSFSPVGMGTPCGCGPSGPSPVMPAPGAHTPSLQLCYRVPQAQLSLAHAGESRGEDMTQPCEDSPHGPHPLVGCKPLLGGRGEGRSITLLPALGRWKAEQPCQPECGVGVGVGKRSPKMVLLRAHGRTLAWRSGLRESRRPGALSRFPSFCILKG